MAKSKTPAKRRLDGGTMDFRPTIPMGAKHYAALYELARYRNVSMPEVLRQLIFKEADSLDKWPTNEQAAKMIYEMEYPK